MDFRIDNDADIKLEHLNVRIEKHGDADATAVDLKLEYVTSNKVLDQFHGDLREALYAPEQGKSKRIPGVEATLPTRVFTQLEPLHWSDEAPCRKLTIRFGINGTTDLILPAATADRFVIQPLDGGSVALTFRVRACCDDERVLGRLPMLLNRLLPMRLEPDITAMAAQQDQPQEKTGEVVGDGSWPFPGNKGGGKGKAEPKEYVTGEEKS
jgi:hypothetical protein